MPTRISSTQVAEGSLYGIGVAFSRFNAAQRKINTGKQLQLPSDNPAGIAQSLSFRSRQDELTQFDRVIDQAKGFLGTTETALASVTSLVQQARALGVQGASDSISTETRNALASQVQNIITQIGNIGNTSYGTRYVFGGQRTDVPPFAQAGTGFAYGGGSIATGDANLTFDVGRGEPMAVNITGDQVITPILNGLAQLRDDIAYGNSRIVSETDLKNMDTQLSNLLNIRADMGAKIQRLDLTKQRNAVSQVNFTKFISDIEDADIPKSVIEFQTAQTAYQAAIQSTAHVFQNSLLDFIR